MTIDTRNITGILNFLSSSSNFHEEYSPVVTFKAVCVDPTSNDDLGMSVLSFFDSDDVLEIPINMRSYLNVKRYLDKQTRHIPTSNELFSVLSNFFGVKIILAFVKEVDNGLFKTYLVTEQNNKIFCCNICFSDVVCMVNTIRFPVYFNKKLLKDIGMSGEEVNYYYPQSFPVRDELE